MQGFKKFLTSYKEGETIFSKGEVQTDFYIINKGKIQFKLSDNRILGTFGKGDFFGEIV